MKNYYEQEFHNKPFQFLSVNRQPFHKARVTVIPAYPSEKWEYSPGSVVQLDDAITLLGSLVFWKEYVPIDFLPQPIRGRAERQVSMTPAEFFSSLSDVKLFQPEPLRAWLEQPLLQETQPFFFFPAYYGSDNFAHFFHDILVLLPLYDALKIKIPELQPLFVASRKNGAFRYPSMSAIIEPLLGHTLSARNFVTGPRSFKQLFFPRPVLNFQKRTISIECMFRMRERLASLLQSQSKGTAERIYIKRNSAVSTRLSSLEPQVSNLEEFEEYLSSKGFVVFDPATLSVEEQIGFFWKSKVIIGLHGAGLINIFLSRNAHLIEIATPPVDWHSLSLFTRAGGFSVDRLITAPMEGDNPVICLDLERIKLFVERQLS